MRLPTQSLAVRQNRSFYAPSVKTSSGFIRASLRLGGDVSLPDQGPIYTPDPGPQVAYAKIGIKCGGDIYTVSTGNNKGRCSASGGTASCDDGKGNSASASCGGGCTGASGRGSCSVKA